MCGCARPCLPAPHWPGAATQRRRQRRRPTLSARTQRRPGRRCRSPAPRPPAAAAGTAGRPPSARPGPSRRPPPAPAPRARTRRHARAPIRASLCQQARRHAMRVPGCPGSAAPSAQAARAGTPCTCRGASVASGAGGRAGHAKRCCRPASTAACDAPTTTAVWPASSGARPGLSTTPRPRMPAHARRELASLPSVSLAHGRSPWAGISRSFRHVLAEQSVHRCTSTGLGNTCARQPAWTATKAAKRGERRASEAEPRRRRGGRAPMSTQPVVRYSHSQALVKGRPARWPGSGASKILNAQPFR